MLWRWRSTNMEMNATELVTWQGRYRVVFRFSFQKYLFALVSMGPIQGFAEALGLWGFQMSSD
jgi:hypothetical protein